MPYATRSQTKADGPQPDESDNPTPLELVLDDPSLVEPPLRLPATLVDYCRASGDILLVCKGGKALQCHSQILACSSDVLRDMLHLTNTGNLSHHPTRVPLPDDDSEDWLQVLVYLYPFTVVLSPSDMTPTRAMAAAALAHKYNMPALAALVEDFFSTFHGKNTNVRYLKCVVPDFKNAAGSRQISSRLTMPDDEWTFLIKARAGADRKVTVTLYGRTSSQEVTTAEFSVAFVSHTDPVAHTYVAPPEVAVNERLGGLALCTLCVELDSLDDGSRGLVRDGFVEVHAAFELKHGSDECNGCFSFDCTSDLYVFKWLDLARKIKHAELEAKCQECIGQHLHYSVFSKTFAADMHAAFTRMSPGQMYTCISKMHLNAVPFISL